MIDYVKARFKPYNFSCLSCPNHQDCYEVAEHNKDVRHAQFILDNCVMPPDSSYRPPEPLYVQTEQEPIINKWFIVFIGFLFLMLIASGN